MCSVWMYVHMSVGALKGQRHWIPLQQKTQAIESHMAWCWKPKKSSLQEKCMLLTA